MSSEVNSISGSTPAWPRRGPAPWHRPKALQRVWQQYRVWL